ncbi:cob(I)yrinic acid a,c-diamide adenosyltransferase [Anaerotignum sp. MB30-C6]|uniref:cob(I)yrinic acid a,c-diamide adenosyltransferase n=1 Tax=Anaerotignum sp. MB30-C6 TaxID=3070814 RepID=UPI0027DCFAB8|nr:cob(I)yrinic acid a,c-diamide adenosyltransferase [Anaerotignum sp. MB30-C6]WMI80321.1 cob(I)yrinic acid a,c-diamide adenosyltransferase [Anaerotignum sp. MB30-C6]
MRRGQISVYYGAGKGKTCVAVGRGLRAIGDDLRVVMIQFMDYHNNKEIELLKKLEPDFRIFRFEKNREEQEIDENVLREISGEIKNAFNFARKIVDTGECEMLLLDGVLECIQKGFLSAEQLEELLNRRPDFMDIILTGDALPPTIAEHSHCIYQIKAEKQ